MNFLKGSLFRRNTEPEELEPMEESGGGILAVWGSPGCGKTVTAVKIAKHLAAQKKNTVLLLCDMTAPMMPCICPPSELEVDKSLGSIFAAQHISVNLIKHNLTTLKRLPHLTMLGLRKKENEYTYAPCTKQQAEELIRGLREIVPYVVIDCSSYIANDILSAVALMEADSVLQLASCDLKSVGYLSSQLPLLGELKWDKDKQYRVKWHTPSEPCVITIAVSVSGGGTAQSTITCNIVDLDGNDPPNPVADDRNDRFRLASIPEKEQVTSASWGIWSPWWQENWEWVENWEKCWHTDRWVDDNNVVHRDRWYHWVDNGWWEDHGWWEFDYNGYSASLTASMRITPDSLSPTATAATMKSGYGIQEKVTARVTTTQSAAVTAAQNAVTYFPEFGYEGFWRLLNRSISGKSTAFAFKNNPYSTYDRPTHFTPIWYPDGSYTPYTWLLDCWTPTGMLSMNLTDSVRISGDLWEEWHIAPSK